MAEFIMVVARPFEGLYTKLYVRARVSGRGWRGRPGGRP